VKDKITMVDNVVLITKLVFLKSFLFCDRRCLTAFFTLMQIDGYILIKIFKKNTTVIPHNQCLRAHVYNSTEKRESPQETSPAKGK